MVWPSTRGRKPNALDINETTTGLLLPNGFYVLVKRFSSKEEARRVVAVMSDPEQVPGPLVAFENHLNVFHVRNEGLPPNLARGLACYLNATLVDLFFRQFNGHTQANATDLRQLPYPKLPTLRAYGSSEWDARVAEWRVVAPALVIGDAGEKFVVWEQEALAALGVVINEKGQMPDVVVHDYERGWLLLVEAVTSHGPVDPKRQEELAALFGDCEAGLVYVTAFMDRRALAERLPTISWETEVWIAEDPTHMIHFEGARFLGPYEATPDAG